MSGESGTEANANVREGIEKGPGWSLANWTVIAVFTALTLVGMVLSVGVIEPLVATSSSGTDAGGVTVPLYVYLYAGLGALGYVFTKLMGELERYTEWGEIEQLAAMAMRIPAAWVLAAGVYLFLGNFGGVVETSGPRFAAGVSFLVGLYVNVALKALGSLADRVLGRSKAKAE
ncbi:hypothetical protein [Natronomonas gomsonensis]|uniref:hypothetical protein n=1 Tax=Natronomonas gomsonensis TaxID=1046043 RepID=UPI0015BDDFD4|nr:hypothetical protein [Natronomonas gomsonensis]